MSLVRRSVISVVALGAFVGLAMGSESDTDPDHLGFQIGQQTPKPNVPGVVDNAGFDISAVRFCRAMSADKECIDPVDDYAAGDTLHLSVTIDGNPKAGVLTVVVFHQHDRLYEMSTDLADMGGATSGIGLQSHLAFTFGMDRPLYAGEGYRFELSGNGTPIGSFATTIRRPPESSGPPKWMEGGVAAGFEKDGTPIPLGTVTPQTTPMLWGEAKLGVGSWVEMTLWRDGELAHFGRRWHEATSDMPQGSIRFPIAPKEGLEPGDWEVRVVADGVEVARYPIHVVEG